MLNSGAAVFDPRGEHKRRYHAALSHRTNPPQRGATTPAPAVQMLAVEGGIAKNRLWKKSTAPVQRIHGNCRSTPPLKRKTNRGAGALVAGTNCTTRNASCAVRAAITL